MEVNRKYGPYALQVYLYLAKNADNYKFALSQQAAENEAGIKRTTFHKYIDLLIAEGYLVLNHGSTYDFYETPPHGDSRNLNDGQENPPSGFPSSFYEAKMPYSNKEIDKK